MAGWSGEGYLAREGIELFYFYYFISMCVIAYLKYVVK